MMSNYLLILVISLTFFSFKVCFQLILKFCSDLKFLSKDNIGPSGRSLMGIEVYGMTLKDLAIVTASNTTNSFYHGKPLGDKLCRLGW